MYKKVVVTSAVQDLAAKLNLKLKVEQIVAWELGHYQLLLVIGVQGGKRNNEYFDGLMYVDGIEFDWIVEGEAICRKN